MPEFRPLTAETLRLLAALEVRADQETFVASNLMTMAQAPFEPGSEIFGIWDGDVPVGLLAVIDMAHPDAGWDDGDDPDGLFIWRLMIDQAYQRRGHGRAALAFARSLARSKGRADLAISVVDEPGGPRPLYEAFGFRPTGRVLDDEVELRLPADSA